MPSGKIKWFSSKRATDLLKKIKRTEIFLHISELENSKLKVLKRQKLKFDKKTKRDCRR